MRECGLWSIPGLVNAYCGRPEWHPGKHNPTPLPEDTIPILVEQAMIKFDAAVAELVRSRERGRHRV